MQWFVKTLKETVLSVQPGLVPAVAARCEFYTVGKDAVLTREGETGDDFFFLYEGQVSVTRVGAKVSQLGPGCFFGEMSLLVNGSKRSATVKAEGRCRFFVLRGPQFNGLVKQSPALRDLLGAVANARKPGK